MKSRLCWVLLLFVCLAGAFGQSADVADPRSGRPRFAWTSGNYFDIRLIELDLSPFDVSPRVGLDYWSGYHHLSYPIAARGDLYLGVGWGLLSLFAEIGYGWNISGADSRTNWELHFTAFSGTVSGFQYGGDAVAGVRSAFKFLRTSRDGRKHFFAGSGLTVAYDSYNERIVLSMPLQTGITISSRRTHQ